MKSPNRSGGNLRQSTAISAARIIDGIVKDGAPEPKEVKIALFLGIGWKAARGFALVDGESLIGWRYATADGPVVIQAEHGETAEAMLAQIRAAGSA
jgi:hypothetical protein